MSTKSNQDVTSTRSPARSSELHTGHRERMRDKFSKTNGEGISDHELLEMLLYYTIPRINTNELAHRLMNEFGSLYSILTATPERLESIQGVGKSTSLFFRLLLAANKRIDFDKYKKEVMLADSLSKIGEFLLDYYKNTQYEEFCIMLLDNGLRLIEFVPISKGSVNSASIDIRTVARKALSKDASYVVLSHNHPKGTLNQSSEDRTVTSYLDAALHAIGITLLDHIIVNDEGYMSTMHSRVKNRISEGDMSAVSRFYDT